jgi:excisionase family DNA binding protein
MAKMLTPPELLTQIQVARVLGLSKRSTQEAIAAGALEPVRIPGLRRPKYRRADVDRLIRGESP